MVQRTLRAFRDSGWMFIPHMPLIGMSYRGKDLLSDIIAGVTVAAILIPQSVGYAVLAGVPAAFGLYAALVGGIAGSLWGSSRFLATGPIAIVSLLTFSAVSSIVKPGSVEFLVLVPALAVMIGIVQIALGIARLGFLIRLVPLSVIVGFSSSAALIIALSQTPTLFGFASSQNALPIQMILDIGRHLFDIHLVSAGVGITSLILLVLLRRFVPRVPAALAVLILGIAGSYFFDLVNLGVGLAGSIPSHLPAPHIPDISLEFIATLIEKALIIALVGFLSSYAVVKEYAHRTKERLDVDQELIGQGFANLLAGLFRGVPVAGSFSRTAVNYESGAVTAWSGVFASIVVVCAILFLSSALAYVPNAVIAAIVVASVLQLVDVPHLWRINKISSLDGVVAATVFVLSFILRANDAVLVGVVLALVLFVNRMMWVDVVEVGIERSLNILRAIQNTEEDIESLPHTLILRIDSAFFYANSERLVERMRALLLLIEGESGRHISFLVLSCAGVDFIDGTGIETLEAFIDELDERRTELCLMYSRRHFREALERAGALHRVCIINNIAELRALQPIRTS